MKSILTTILILICFTSFGQTKDSVKVDTVEMRTLYRNATIIQQYLHKVHIDGVLRDQLDSVYQVSATIFEKRLKTGKSKKGGK